MYYKCEWCGEVDSSPYEFEDKEVGYRGLTCHRCGSDVHEADCCIECEEYFSKEIGDDFFYTARDITGQGVGYCATCLKALCDVKTGLEYFAKFDLSEGFVDTWLLEGQNLPYAKSVLMKVVDNATNDDESLQKEMWSFIAEDSGHFADYIYNKSKGGDK